MSVSPNLVSFLWYWTPRTLYTRTLMATYRIGEAASALGVRVETLRRWEREGRLVTSRTAGGQRVVAASEVARLMAERNARPPIARASQRNRLPGVITGAKRGNAPAAGG